MAIAQSLPPAVNSGLPTREEIDPTRRQQTAPPSRLKIDGDIERSPCALADPAYAAVNITLTSATFNNLGPVDAATLAPAYADFLGVEKPFASVCEIRDRAATILRRLGYVAAVLVPVQRIENGAVAFEVIYARLTAVRVRGDVGRNEAAIARYLNNLELGKPFNRYEAERYLLLARDMPGFDVRLALRPAGTVPGEMIGEVSVRRTPFELDASIQNLAPAETGRWSGQLRASAYGLTGLGDRTTVSLSSTSDFDEQQVLQIGHDMALGGDGLRLGGRFTYAWTHPGLGPTVPEVRARTLYANLEASYPFVRAQSGSVSGAFGFDFVNQEVDFAGAPLSTDRLRVLYARLDTDAIDLRGTGPDGTSAWRVTGSLELRQGVDVFDASINCLANVLACGATGFVPPSLFDGDPTATVLRFTGLAELHPLRNITFSFQPRGQVASGALYAFEQYSAGNYTVGRGYDPGALTGDDGLGFNAELRYDRFKPLDEFDVVGQPYVFVDHSWVWDRNQAAGSQPAQLTSVGAGARVIWAGRARLDLALAVPLRDAGPVQSGDVRVLMSLTTRLLPWGAR
ncbi:MAG: ShlB/FhaC/HecB family hemolysin secretion/activation protein [Polymorphobacter sp.]